MLRLACDVKRLDGTEDQAQRSLLPAAEGRRPAASASDPIPTLTNPAYPESPLRTFSS